MKPILIGSRALKHWFPDFKREPSDTDYISEDETLPGDVKFCPSFKYLAEKYPEAIASPNILYTLKLSHSFWDVFWDKTMFDLTFLREKGARVEDEELYKLLYKDCAARYGKKQVFLNKENNEFFDDGVPRIYEHDSIHEAVANYERPLYFKIKKDEASAQTFRELFDLLSREDKIKLCLEEIHVVALERFLIPSDFRANWRGAVYKSIKLLITSMTSGYFARFLSENFVDIYVKNADNSFITKFKNSQKLIKL